MNIEQANGNWNFLYEFKIGDDWYPCNIVDENPELENRLVIFTRNGTITEQSIKKLRKMSKINYLRNRENTIKLSSKIAYDHGFHKNIDDDLNLFDKENALRLYIERRHYDENQI